MLAETAIADGRVSKRALAYHRRSGASGVDHVEGRALVGGQFLMAESPRELAGLLVPFLRAHVSVGTPIS